MRSRHSFLLFAAPLLFAGCGDAPSFQRVVPTSATLAVAPDTELALSDRWLAYLADEATSGAGTDLNGDGDLIDAVAVAVDIPSKTETVLGVAARTAIWNGGELYLVVSELADGRNWEPVDTGDALVLLHWSKARGVVEWVDDVGRQAGRMPVLTAGELLFYVAADLGTAAGATNLRVLRRTAPLAPVAVDSNDVDGALFARLFGEEEGLVFVVLDEPRTGRDLDGDGDVQDDVLALLDGTESFAGGRYEEEVRSTGLALSIAARPRARARGEHDWNVAFFVSEFDQGKTNLNDATLFPPTWRPPQCVDVQEDGTLDPGDLDSLDDVLFAIPFAAWRADPVAFPPFDTGLAGAQTIEIAGNAVAVIAVEGADGVCDLNDDGDLDDRVVRWMDLAFPFFPIGRPELLLAVADVPGGTHGLAELDGRFVIVADEFSDRRDFDGDGLQTRNLLAWIEPNFPPFWTIDLPFPGAWVFQHDTGATVPEVGVSWLARCGRDRRLGVGYEEELLGTSINSPGMGGDDTDMLDSVPAFVRFSSDGGFLVLERVPVAAALGNAGISIGADIGFFRASELEDSRDWNGDGDEQDFVLLRTPLSTPSATKSVSTLNGLDGPAIAACETDAPAGAAFIADEAQEGPMGTDFDGDGDTTDLVVRYFRF